MADKMDAKWEALKFLGMSMWPQTRPVPEPDPQRIGLGICLPYLALARDLGESDREHNHERVGSDVWGWWSCRHAEKLYASHLAFSQKTWGPDMWAHLIIIRTNAKWGKKCDTT